VVGSITHCKGYAAASVAKESEFLAIGVDAELNHVLPTEIGLQITTLYERAWLVSAPADVNWIAILFGAKESIFKAWFPLQRTWLGFEDVSISFRPAEQAFYATPTSTTSLDSGIVSRMSGRYLVINGFIFTSVVIKR